MKIVNLRINDQINPIGINLKNVTFSWEVREARGSRQAGSRFILSDREDFSTVLYDSGETRLSCAAYTPDLSGITEEGRTYYVRVQVTDETGDTASAEACFEGGRAGGFQGRWITSPMTQEMHPIFRKKFELTAEEVSQKARLYICGLGLYEAYLNGEKIGNQYMTPYFTDYRYHVQYQTYDIAPLLKEGENVLDVWLGEGWYKGRFGYLVGGQLREYYGDEYKLIADLQIGGKVIGTDETWMCLRSPILISGIYDGEVYDARRDALIAAPGYRDISWAKYADAPQASLEPMTGLPVVRRETFPVKEIIRTPLGETVLDFGQEITGWVEFTAEAPLDRRIILQYSEVMQNGCFYNENLRSATAEFRWISDGTRKAARPHFTFFGFRYVKVTGMDVDETNKADFTAAAIYSDLQETGWIETANAKINRLIENTKWGEKGNFLDIPTDCPQRDERCGWTGDAQIFANAASYHMRTQSFFRKYLKDMALEQRGMDGAVPYVVPDILTIAQEKCAEPPFDVTEDLWGVGGASVWGDAAAIIPWDMYLHSGNLRWLAEQYDNMKQWVDFIISMDENHCGGKRLWTCGFHFGDWLSLDVEASDNDMDNREGGTDKHYIASAFYYHSAQLTAKAARLIGIKEDAAYYEKIAGEVRAAVRAKYVTGPGELSIRTQTAYAVAIHLNIFDEEEKPAAGERLVELLHLWKDHLATGFVGTAYLCDALTETGHTDLAYTLLFNEDYPSWLYEVNLGATTVWERWNSILPDGKISGTGMNSLNHYAYGVIVEWIYRAVCGLQLVEEKPAGTAVILAPHPDARLGQVSTCVQFAAGTYKAGWKMDGNRIEYTFTVPFDCELCFKADRALKNIRLNGETVTQAELPAVFTAGSYVIEAESD
ncbi:MAG: family 78 glycoside hydrolase catalytic domain [Lachnospiraceae bacterium]|nr:family 78 glycoside hydrolase catalytic domain [Lachnospiraceae bacterium]